MRFALFLPTGARHRRDVWHVKFRHEGKQIMRSTGQTDRTAAERTALDILRAVTQAHEGPVVPLTERIGAPIAQIVAVYLEQPTPAAATRAQNVRDLLRLVETRFKCERQAAMTLPCGVINAATVDAFIRARQGQGRIRRDRVLPVNRSINSFLNHARGVFSARMLEVYTQAGLSIPDSALQGFLTYPALPDGRRAPARTFHGADGVTLKIWVDDEGMIQWRASCPVIWLANDAAGGQCCARE